MTFIRPLLRPVFRLAAEVSKRALKVFFSILSLLPRDIYLRARAAIADSASNECEIAGIRFYVNHPLAYLRAREFLKVEPELVAWIDDFIGDGSVLYDVGANIGAYSLYAARRGARVVALEPFAGNYDLLNRNIVLNGLGERVTAFNIAAHDRTEVTVLNLSKMSPGGAIHAVGTARAGSQYEMFEPVHAQGVIGYRLDDFVDSFQQPFPTHVKIDVDGNDPLVLAGMAKMLDDPRLLSVAIEINPEHRDTDQGVVESLTARGFEGLDDARYRNPGVGVTAKAYNVFFVRRQH